MFSDVEKGCIGNKWVKSAVKASLFSRKRFENLLLAYVILREEFTNTEFFLVRIFPYLDWIRSSPNMGNYGPEKNIYLDVFLRSESY